MSKHVSNPGTQNTFPIGNGFAPSIAEGGPKCVVVPLDFTTDNTIEIDFTQIQTAGALSFVQSIWVDNSANANDLTLTFDQTGQAIVVPATAQGIYPVIAPISAKCLAVTVAGIGVVCMLIAVNVPMPLSQTGPVTFSPAVVNASMVPVQKNFTSANVVVTGADQVALAANAARTRLIIQAPFNNAGRVTLNFGAAAVAEQGITLSPGEKFDTSVGPVDARDIHAIGTAADNLIVVEA